MEGSFRMRSQRGKILRHRISNQPISNQPIVNLFAHKQHIGHCVIAGEAKCGTSSLYKYLCQHPNMLPAKRKEINYISSLNEQKPSIVEYSAKLCETGGHPKGSFVTIDGSQQYFRWPGNVPQILYNLVPKSKIIVLLRNPVDRLYSNYWMNRTQSNKHQKLYPTFNDYVQNASWKENPINKYAENLNKWYKIFPKDQILVVNSHEFFGDTDKTLNIIFDYLGLSPYRVMDLIPVIPFAKPTSKPEKHYPPIPPEIRLLLAQHFEPLDKELYALIGRDFGWNEIKH